MSHVGTGSPGYTFIGTTTNPKFFPIGTLSGLTNHGVLVAGGSGAFQAVVPGTSGFVLISNGPASNPSWAASGTASINTLTGTTGGPLSPTANNFNLLAGTVAAGTTPVAIAGAGSTLTTNIQISQALVAADATKIGLSNFDSASFAVAASGFVSLSTTGVGKTITGDTGGALSPIANNWNIVGLSGSKTSGTGATLTIKSPPYADFPGTATAAVNTGSFITAGGNIILDLPSPAADGDLIEVICTTANLIAVDAPATNFIRIGTLITSGGGTATSTQIGDALVLRYRLSDLTWYATSSIGTWVMA